jgi:hypothetical protein
MGRSHKFTSLAYTLRQLKRALITLHSKALLFYSDVGMIKYNKTHITLYEMRYLMLNVQRDYRVLNWKACIQVFQHHAIVLLSQLPVFVSACSCGNGFHESTFQMTLSASSIFREWEAVHHASLKAAQTTSTGKGKVRSGIQVMLYISGRAVNLRCHGHGSHNLYRAARQSCKHAPVC